MSKRFSVIYTASVVLITYLMASSSLQAAVPTTILGETQDTINAAINHIAPLYTYQESDPIAIKAINGNIPAELDGAIVAPATITPSMSSYFNLDIKANTLKAVSNLNSTWKNFTLTSVPTSWNATTTVTLTETVRDGVSNPAGAWTLNIILTKGTGAADLTNTVLSSFLTGCSTATYAANASGTILSSTSPLTAGWTAKAYVADGSAAAQAATMDPINLTIGNTLTTVGGTALNFSAALTNMDSWNLATNAATLKNIYFTAPGGRSIAMTVKPGSFARTAGISAGLLTALNAMPSVYNQTSTGYQAALTMAVSDIMDIIKNPNPDNIKKGLASIAFVAISKASYGVGSFGTTADSTKLGLVALASDNVTDVIWSTEGKSLVITGKIGNTAPKKFICDMTGLTTFSSTNPVCVQFKSFDGDTIFLKCFDSTGYTSTTNTDIPASAQDTELVLIFLNLLSGVTTIQSRTLANIISLL